MVGLPLGCDDGTGDTVGVPATGVGIDVGCVVGRPDGCVEGHPGFSLGCDEG